jgi:hypothetical protein
VLRWKGASYLRDEAETNLRGGEVPLSEDEGEAVEAGEDESVAEATEQGQESDDRLGQEEEVRPPHELQDVLGIEALEEAPPDLVGTVDVGIFAGLASALSLMIEKNGGASLWDREEVDDLDDSAEDELSVEDPAPVEVLRDEATDDRGDNGTGAGGEDDVEHGELLVLGTEHVGDHAKSDTAASRRQTTEDTSSKNSVEVGGKHAGDLEDVDKTEGYLHDPFTTKLLREGSPELATETVGDKEGHLTETSLEVRDTKVLGHAGDSIAVDGGIVVHTYLDPEDHGENSPFLCIRKGEAELRRSDSVFVGEFDARISTLVNCSLSDLVCVVFNDCLKWSVLHICCVSDCLVEITVCDVVGSLVCVGKVVQGERGVGKGAGVRMEYKQEKTARHEGKSHRQSAAH